MTCQEGQSLAVNLTSANIDPIAYPLDTTHPWGFVSSYHFNAAVVIPINFTSLNNGVDKMPNLSKQLAIFMSYPISFYDYVERTRVGLKDNSTANIVTPIPAAKAQSGTVHCTRACISVYPTTALCDFIGESCSITVSAFI